MRIMAINPDLKNKLKDQGIELLIVYHRKNIQSLQLCKSDEYHLKHQNRPIIQIIESLA